MKKATFSGTRWILCNVLSLALMFVLCTGTALAETGMVTDIYNGIEVSFTFERMSTMASNQLAVWIADESGAVVRTLLVTDFTAGRRGYQRRDMSLPAWVEAAKPESMADIEIDALSSVTPRQGDLLYIWDLTDEQGNPVETGLYMVYVEGTLYWNSDVLYSAMIDTASIQDDYAVQMTRTEPDNQDNEQMVTAVVIRGTHID